MQMPQLPQTKYGLYDPRHEHDGCGVGVVANIRGIESHDIVKNGLEVLKNLTHRGACGCDPLTGDGAGILVQIPDSFMRSEASALGAFNTPTKVKRSNWSITSAVIFAIRMLPESSVIRR